MAKKEMLKIATPKGKLHYPWLRVPDVKFNSEGVYKCGIVLDKDDPKVVDIVGKLDALLDESYQKALKECKPQDKSKVQKAEPYKLEFTEAGEETGNIIITAKSKYKPRVVDASLVELPDEISPYGGTIGKMSVFADTYYMASTKTAGVTLYLQGVQVLKLVTGAGADMGFDVDDEYEAIDTSHIQSQKTTHQQQTVYEPVIADEDMDDEIPF